MRRVGNAAYVPAATVFDFLKRPELPITLHTTHAKTGSTWVDAILRTLFGKGVKPRGYQVPDFSARPERGFSVLMPREEILAHPELAARFQEIYGNVLPAGRYEADATWVGSGEAR